MICKLPQGCAKSNVDKAKNIISTKKGYEHRVYDSTKKKYVRYVYGSFGPFNSIIIIVVDQFYYIFFFIHCVVSGVVMFS